MPMTLGHETAGSVEKLGAGVTGLALGERVLVAGIWGCGRCRACAEGEENACEYWETRAAVPLGPGLGFNGGMAEYMVAPARALHPIGPLDLALAAPLADAGVTPCHAINLARPHLRADDTVVVIGAGGLGHMAIQILRATTGCRIVAVDVDAARLTAAKAYGADEIVTSDDGAAEAILSLTHGAGARAVFDFVGATATLGLANAIVCDYGTLVVIGLDGASFNVVADAPPVGRPKWGVRFIRPYGATTRDIFEVIGLAQAGKLKADIERRPLRDAVLVLDALARGAVRGRAVLVP